MLKPHTLVRLMSASSRLDTGWEFFLSLRDAGRVTAQRWLATNYDAIGVRATLDLRAAVS